MENNGPLFILAGNGPYENRGCEAIVRGTVSILREKFTDPRFICISYFHSKQQYERQCQYEADKSIIHLAANYTTKKNMIKNIWKPKNWVEGFYYIFDRNKFYSRVYRDIFPYLNEVNAVLSVGGDNYSLDYGIPTRFIALDDLILGYKKPVILWGASIGPFSSIPDYERYMGEHLKRVTGIFSRESATTEYLRSIGITSNVYSVADPAFVMAPVRPEGKEKELQIEKDAIGLNFSPLMAKYVTGGDMDQWLKISGSIIETIARMTERPVYLIPHVISKGSNDYVFMKKALSRIEKNNKNIVLVPPIYNASETKWIISQMTFFAGARTHATIAALSSSVPTLSFAYSIKAKGINQDIFGHTDFCIDPHNLCAQKASDKIINMIDNNKEIKRSLIERIPEIQASALKAGNMLKMLTQEKVYA